MGTYGMRSKEPLCAFDSRGLVGVVGLVGDGVARGRGEGKFDENCIYICICMLV